MIVLVLPQIQIQMKEMMMFLEIKLQLEVGNQPLQREMQKGQIAS
jgi:hypothetical protein